MYVRVGTDPSQGTGRRSFNGKRRGTKAPSEGGCSVDERGFAIGSRIPVTQRAIETNAQNQEMPQPG